MRVCKLQQLVNAELFGHSHAADCFCGTGGIPGGDFRNECVVLAFIEEAVRVALERAIITQESRRGQQHSPLDDPKPPRGMLAAMREARKRARRPLP